MKTYKIALLGIFIRRYFQMTLIISNIENNVNQSKVARDSFLPIFQTVQPIQQNNLDFQRQHLQQPHLLYQQQQHHYLLSQQHQPQQQLHQQHQQHAKTTQVMNISSSSSSTDSSRESSPDCSPGRSDLNEKVKKKRKTPKSFIKDSQQRASASYIRRKGILKKLKEFDVITGLQTAFITIGSKGKLHTHATNGSKLEKLLPNMIDLINKTNTQYKDAETSCNLKIDHKINTHCASQRIIDAKETEKIIVSRYKPFSKSNSFFNGIELSQSELNQVEINNPGTSDSNNKSTKPKKTRNKENIKQKKAKVAKK